ncbi:hypothetical protein FC75_GL002027 [Lacticaseibacillus camelliae DSM 22697 = JCM 13995]|uniref:SGNH hydrolase-type esterase domain-containing protein n=1 Tax=Lacticaseibacillus camelliae DSM 22697 = JCM 13995 TaxID=1423730 RepID=A0A0R2FE96_9LACO|nr:hypothetical protein FC75_GL002027 [Lacticaseibacillus camelliae DSM 22697 = JCM 13995]
MEVEKSGILFHNVERIRETSAGPLLDRVPETVFAQLDEPATHTSSDASGVELRFVMNAPTVTLMLAVEKAAEAQVAYIRYGTFPGTWSASSRILTPQKATITIPRPVNLFRLQALARQQHLAFDPAVVRVCLPYCRNYFYGVSGDVAVPAPTQMPQRTYLAYGSSITHGSLALNPFATYPQLIADRFNADLLNFGFPGSAWLEPSVADYLVGRDDWQFASIEMGINMLGAFSPEAFRQRVRRFIAPFAQDSRPVVATDMVVTDYPEDPAKVAAFRRIVREETTGKLPYISGLDLLADMTALSSDLLHPTAQGMAQIAAHLGDFLASQVPA